MGNRADVHGSLHNQAIASDGLQMLVWIRDYKQCVLLEVAVQKMCSFGNLIGSDRLDGLVTLHC